MIVLFLLVMGGIYMGIFTPTEAGAIGAFGAVVITLIGRRLNMSNFRRSIIEAAQTTGMIGLLLVGAFIFNRFMTISGLPFLLGEVVAGLGLPPIQILIFLIILYILLGCIMDPFAAIVITIPIIFPLVLAMGFNPICLK